ncbi:DeoR/GlpR family DNA-binding transcription regulator [Eubacteriales bacterium OttesenSCG-928-A19]|nr:DeoR/GlpR family DNA-binding transcription regulator [Eubacteriales bacterium OttesenSCG-928-A19]
MFGIERVDQILDMLQDDRVVSVHEMAERLFVSEATVRRDLDALEKRGMVKRIYGGAVLIRQANRDVPLYLREGEQTDAKNIIGQKAASIVKEDDVLFIDASSTAYHVVRHLPEQSNLVVITCGLKAAMALGERHIKTFCTGGLMIDNSYSFVGRHAEDLLKEVSVDIMFFSSRGVTKDGLITDTSVEETQLRQTMFRNAKRKVFLCASSKIGSEYFYRLCQIDELDDVFCETDLPESWQRRLQK